MRKFYHCILNSFGSLIVFFEIKKMYVSEKYALIIKRKLYRDIKWNKWQRKEFDEYWKRRYGKKITSRGHKLYEAINSEYRLDYIPDFLFATKIEPFFNSYFYAKLYSDKSLTEMLYNKSSLVQFPKTYLVNCSGIFYDGHRKIVTNEKALEILSNIDEAVIKPTVGGNSGKGVLVCNFVKGYDKKNKFNVFDFINSDQENYIIQEKMKQHDSLEKIYSHSVNTFRAITYVLNGTVYCADLVLRIGSGGSNVDNIHAGGIAVGVKSDGTLLKYGYRLGYSSSNEKMKEHPDSRVVFKNHKVAGANEIVKCAKELHGLTPHLGMVSWDFMVSKDGKPILIEANYWGQAVWLTQIVHGKPFFGEQTFEILKLIMKD